MRYAIVLTLLTFAGCAALDRAASATTKFSEDPDTQAAAGALPFSEWIKLGLIAAGGLSTAYLNIRRRQWKTAFGTVVTTVEPFIPKDEAQRDRLKLHQGHTVTKLVKAAKA